MHVDPVGRGTVWARLALAVTALGAGSGGCAAPQSEPEGRAAPDAAEVPEAVVSVPFELVRNQIVLQVRLGEHGPFNMLLDTAVNPSAIDMAAAERAGQPVDRSVQSEASGTGSDRVTIFGARIEGLTMEGHEFEPIDALATNMTALGERLGRPLHGILGHSFLSTRAVRIDYPGRVVHIFEGPAPEPPDGERFEMSLLRDGTDVLIEPVYLNGQPLTVTLDTGSSLTLEVYGHAATRLGLDDLRASADSGTVVGARGEASILAATADSLRVGPFTLGDPEVVFPERDRDTDGNIGNGFFRDLVLTVDYVANRLIITR